MKLYEITADYSALLEAIEAGEIPEEAINDTLESVTAILEDKVDNIACYIKNLTAFVAEIKAEEQALAERRRSKEKQIERMKAYLSEALLRVGRDKVETARNKVSFRKSQSVFVENETAFIEWAKVNAANYLTYKEPTINKTAIKTAIAEGIPVIGASVETKQNIQIK